MKDWFWLYGGFILWGILGLLYFVGVLDLPWLMGR